MMGSMMRRAMIGDSATLNVDFTSMTNGGQLANAGFTFTNATTTARTYINSNGVLATATTNEPRFDHDPTTLAPKGLLIEATATNFASNSETFPTSGTGLWAYEDVTANATKITAPDGTANAIQFNETTANNVHRIGQSVSGSAGAVSVSVWVKVLQPGTPRRLFINANTFMNARGLFDIDPAVQTGASGTAVSVTGTAANRAGTWIKYPNDWYRCTLIGTYSTASTVYFQINRASSSTATDEIFAGSTTNGLAIWGAQVEAGSGSSYIPTGASTVQRLADECSMTGTNFSSWFNATEGTFLAHARRIRTTDLGRIVSANDNTTTESIDLGADTTGEFIVTDGGSALATISPGTVTANTAFKIAGAYKLNDVQAALGGTLGTADTSVTLPTVDRLMVGRQAGGSPVYLNGTVAVLKYWPTRLTNAQLQSFTT
jgi:hypothetical protein